MTCTYLNFFVINKINIINYYKRNTYIVFMDTRSMCLSNY